MAPAFSVLRSSSRRRETSKDDQFLDARYGDSGISAPNQGATWPEWSNSPVAAEPERTIAPMQRAPNVDKDSAKSSITIIINLPWKSKCRSNSLPPTQGRFREEPARRAPVEHSPVVSPRHVSSTHSVKSHSIPARISPRPPSQLYFRETAGRSPKSQDLISRCTRQKPPTPLLGVLTPVSETFDDRWRSSSTLNDTASTHHPLRLRRSPLPPPREFNNWYDASDEEREDQCEPVYFSRSRSPAPELVCQPPLPGHHHYMPRSHSPAPELVRRSLASYNERRARSVEPSMHHRRPGSIGSASTHSIDSDVDSVAESGYGSFTSPSRVEFSQAPATKNVYNTTATDYSRIIREVEADYQAAKRTKNKDGTSDGKTPCSAGSGISADSGYSSGPQVLVPSGEDLWG